MNLVFLICLYFGTHAAHPAGSARIQGCTVTVRASSESSWSADVVCKDRRANYIVLTPRRWDKTTQKPLDDLEIWQQR